MSSVRVGEVHVYVERTLDGVKLRIAPPDGREITLLLSHLDAMKLGRTLLLHGKAGATGLEQILRKLAALEHEILKLSDRVRVIERRLGGGGDAHEAKS